MWIDANGNINVRAVPHPEAHLSEAVLRLLWSLSEEELIRVGDALDDIEVDIASRIDSGGFEATMEGEGLPLDFVLEVREGECANVESLIHTLNDVTERWRLDALYLISDFIDTIS